MIICLEYVNNKLLWAKEYARIGYVRNSCCMEDCLQHVANKNTLSIPAPAPLPVHQSAVPFVLVGDDAFWVDRISHETISRSPDGKCWPSRTCSLQELFLLHPIMITCNLVMTIIVLSCLNWAKTHIRCLIASIAQLPGQSGYYWVWCTVYPRLSSGPHILRGFAIINRGWSASLAFELGCFVFQLADLAMAEGIYHPQSLPW